MVTNAPIVPFAEIWNTYGETLTNAELLVRYGFLLDSNENDVIVWDPRDLRDFSSGVLGEEQRTRNSGTTSCEEGIDMSDNDCHAHVRRGLSFQYQSLDDVGGKRDQNIREAHRSSKPGLNDDHHLLGVPGSSTSRPHLATFTNSGGSESSLLNTDLSAAQNLLDHLDDLIFLWHCGSGDIWRSSNLVYDPFSRDGDGKYDAAHCVHRRRRRGEEAEDLVSMKAVPVVATSADLLTPSGLRGEEVSKLKALDGAHALDAHSTVEKVSSCIAFLDFDIGYLSVGREYHLLLIMKDEVLNNGSGLHILLCSSPDIADLNTLNALTSVVRISGLWM